MELETHIFAPSLVALSQKERLVYQPSIFAGDVGTVANRGRFFAPTFWGLWNIGTLSKQEWLLGKWPIIRSLRLTAKATENSPKPKGKNHISTISFRCSGGFKKGNSFWISIRALLKRDDSTILNYHGHQWCHCHVTYTSPGMIRDMKWISSRISGGTHSLMLPLSGISDSICS